MLLFYNFVINHKTVNNTIINIFIQCESKFMSMPALLAFMP